MQAPRKILGSQVRPRRPRFVYGIVGLALAVYAVAALTGEWLGTPLWVDSGGVSNWPGNAGAYYDDDGGLVIDNSLPLPEYHVGSKHTPVAWVVGLLGLALVAFAWPRRTRDSLKRAH